MWTTKKAQEKVYSIYIYGAESTPTETKLFWHDTKCVMLLRNTDLNIHPSPVTFCNRYIDAHLPLETLHDLWTVPKTLT